MHLPRSEIPRRTPGGISEGIPRKLPQRILGEIPEEFPEGAPVEIH